jgi:short-subunit dehydrogenase
MNRRTAIAVAAAGAAVAITGIRRRRADLTGQVALVTGGSRGLGLAIAAELQAVGCVVAIAARDRDELSAAAGHLGADVTTIVCDVTDEAQVAAMVAEVEARLGPIDMLINNAGIIQVGPIAALTVGNFYDAMKPMFFGMVHTSLAVLPGMRARRRGWIVNITSIGGKIGVPHLLPYAAAKFAAVGFSDGLHAEVAADGIRVTTVVPGLMRTGSDVQARFSGNATAEYGWFAAAAALPGLSMDGRRAARRIVSAVVRGRTQVVLTLPVRAAALAHGIAPATTQTVLTVVQRLLPSPGTDRDVAGARAGAGTAARWPTGLNRRAGNRLNQPPLDADTDGDGSAAARATASSNRREL